MERERAVCIPLSPSTYVGRSIADGDATTMRRCSLKYGLEPGYLFYPAQFWPHKNHATLLAALALLRDRGVKKRLVLCGSDRGARDRRGSADRAVPLADQVTHRSVSSIPPSSARSIAARWHW